MRRIIRYKQLAPEKGITYSLPHIGRLRKLPKDDPRKFPDPIPGLGKEHPFDEDEIDAYLERQVALRDEVTESEAA